MQCGYRAQYLQLHQFSFSLYDIYNTKLDIWLILGLDAFPTTTKFYVLLSNFYRDGQSLIDPTTYTVYMAHS
jgi:hypothetical protein